MAWGDIPNWAYESVRALLQTLKAVEPSTYYHCLRVGEYSRKLAQEMGLNEYEQKVAEFAGMLHDIGKVGIDKSILLKPSRLDPHEIEIIRNHSLHSEEIIQPFAKHPFFKLILPAIRGHHERLDGAGYPDKIAGESIPLIARVILVVDTYDAMAENRVYRKGLSDEVIYSELVRCSGTQFDPKLVKIFLDAHTFWKKQPSTNEEETFNQIVKKVA